MAATWLADVLRAAGCRVDETLVPDWKSRGHTDGPFTPVGVLGHHTAGPAAGDLPSLRTVRDGRPDLPGPLAQLMLSRAGVFVPIAAGRAWHAGAGAAPFVPRGDGNRYLIGIEAESAGTGDWTAAQLAAYPQGVAALLAHLGWDASHFLGHLEFATPPGRKVDPAGWPGGMAGFRATLTDHLNGADVPLSDDDIARIWTYAIGGVQARDRLHGVDSIQLPAIAQAVADVRGKVLSNFDLAGRPADTPDDLVGHVLSTEAMVRALVKALAAMGHQTAAPAAQVDAAAVAAALAGNRDFLANLAAAVNDDAARRLAS